MKIIYLVVVCVLVLSRFETTETKTVKTTPGKDEVCNKKKCEYRCRLLSSKHVDLTGSCVDDLGCFCHDDLIMIQMDSKPVKDPSKWTINVPSIDPNDAKPGKVKKPK
uniref:Uncharacterized protein n=1 Tax=Homalodisca liturata TaxID=320908 RepID=A0A1B6JPH5_9HEMI